MPVPVEISGLIVPMKQPRAGKSRLRGAVDERDHPALVLALAWDTLAAVTAAGVPRVVVVAADPAAVSGLRRPGVEIVGERGPGDLNSALRQGEALLRERDPAGVVGAIQADLPALRPADLAAAVAAADGARAFVADAEGTGTTLLLSAAGGPLDPRFGPGSAPAHAQSGAAPLALAVPSLRRDVDTPADLAEARELGVGARTRALLRAREVA
ncbi:2-phospho-L-lactate guanylyltransferase [Amycolatopsis thermophila]|uniref:Phosphoenolpyruvate guanylyltransferase n=1 Tax=Amycolatopsis thermophila TaxID=206084 RepID=A0ABU0ENR5_9PSEU|nr:2-phospho-L-lactate guanylyltransferase [Amycolatopsis thermophila]MDQ0376809.1 2-phospho-L-lactate guanylyltransferase [Amycolatopsis thermophila]